MRMGSATRCHFVNPNYAEVFGQRCHPTIGALPEVPDTVLLAVNPLRAARFAREAAEAGVRSLVVPGGGVVEGGEAAATMQREVGEIAMRHGIALLGPNCMGVVDWTTGSACYIGDVNPWLPRGHVAGLAQSGSVTDAFLHAPGTRIGYSRIVSVGAEVVLDLCDYLAWSLDDPETHAVMLFVEGFKRPETFLALADRALELGKPILAVKVGRSEQARAAAIAHSGSLAGEDRVTDAALDAAGVIRCRDLDELLEQAELVAGAGRLGRRVGRGRTGVVTVSTGEASLVADLAAQTGLDLPPVPDAARDAILRDLPTMGYIGNPLDPWGADDAPAAYSAAFDAFAASGAYDVLAIVHDSPFRDLSSEVETAREVVTPLIRATAGRPDLLPVYVSLTAGDVSEEIKATLDEAGGMPMLRGATEAFAAVARLAWWERRHAERAAGAPRRAAWPALAAERVPWGADRSADPLARHAAGSAPRRALSERESLERLGHAGIPVTPWRAVAADPDAAVAAWRELGAGSGRRQARRAGPRPQVGGRRRVPRPGRRGGGPCRRGRARRAGVGGGPRCLRPPRGADGRARDRAHRRRPSRPGLRARRAGRPRRRAGGGAGRRRGPARARGRRARSRTGCATCGVRRSCGAPVAGRGRMSGPSPRSSRRSATCSSPIPPSSRSTSTR